ncbi:MAG: sodium-dependent transporter [Flavobacteriales bacterium]|nr:sodium-dependent transporter [Flavobacteriales bacterium]
MSELKFSSKTATILSLIGVAVGLGNMWRFPYMMGQYGGSAFLFIFLIFIFVFGIPALTAELSLGRATGRGPVGALTQAFGAKLGKPIALFMVFTIFIANSYYLVVIANVVYSAYHGAVFGFLNEEHPISAGLGHHTIQFGIALFIICCCMLVVYKGVQNGIERVSVTMVPFFGLVMIYLIYHTLNLPGALDYMMAFMKPDFSALNARNIFAAMGQAFFTLSLGGTLMVIYGNYVKDKESIPAMAISTGLGDLSAALLASLFIVPAVLVYGLDLEEGPMLLFSTLPSLFGQMPGGTMLGTLFLVSLSFMAFLSSVATIQLFIMTMVDNTKISFKKSIIIVGTVQAVAVSYCAFNPEIIGTLDLIFGSGMQVLGSCIAIIAVTIGLGKVVTMKQIFGDEKRGFHITYYNWLKFGVPTALIATLLLYVYDTFNVGI